MPKITMMLFALICVFNSFAQNSLSLGITMFPYYSSLGKFMNEDHLLLDGNLLPYHDSRNYFNYGLNISYVLEREKIFHQIQLIGGHRFVKEYYGDYTSDDGFGGQSYDTSWTKYNQINFGLNYIVGGKFDLGKLSLSGGIGLSVQRIGNGIQEWYIHYEYLVDGQIQYERTLNEQGKFGGGIGYGLVSNLQLEYQLGPKFSMGCSFQNYMMHFIFRERDHRIGNDDWTDGWLFPDTQWDYWSENNDQKLGFSRITPSIYCSVKF